MRAAVCARGVPHAQPAVAGPYISHVGELPRAGGLVPILGCNLGCEPQVMRVTLRDAHGVDVVEEKRKEEERARVDIYGFEDDEGEGEEGPEASGGGKAQRGWFRELAVEAFEVVHEKVVVR